jgi:hypothetical protein
MISMHNRRGFPDIEHALKLELLWGGGVYHIPIYNAQGGVKGLLLKGSAQWLRVA